MNLRPLTVLITLAVAACAQSVGGTENALTQAGFRIAPADTPRRMAALTALQPHKLSMQIRDAKAVWVYADPTICHCLYVGDQIAYDTYLARLREKQDLEYADIVRRANANNALPYPFQWTDWDHAR